MKEPDVKGDGDAHTHADLTNQVDFCGDLAGQLFLIGAALEFLKVVAEAESLAIFRRNGDAEGGHASRLTLQFDIDADGDNAVEGVLQMLRQGHSKQILIFQLSSNQLLHGIHQRIGCFLIIVVLNGGAIRFDDLLQRGLRLIEDVHTIAGGRRELQAHGGLGLEQNTKIDPEDSAVHVDIHGQLFLKVQIGSQGGQQALGTVQGNR